MEQPKKDARAESQVLAPELQHLQTAYAFASMSILSGSKIQQKTTALLAHMARFSFTDVTTKPGVVAVHARSSVVAKMIGVVEIAKREVEKDKGKWYQYSRLYGQTEDVKEKRPKRKNGTGKTLAEWEKEKDGLGRGVVDPTTGNDVDMADASDQGQAPEEDDGDGAFEVMKHKGAKKNARDEGSPGQESRKKIRAVPVMTIYMARVPIPEFKNLYGYDNIGSSIIQRDNANAIDAASRPTPD
jgi:hypothetical protein